MNEDRVLHNFAASYGLPLIAGGENPGGGPAVATPPAPAAPAAPAPAAQPAAPAPPAAPAQPGVAPGAPGTPAAPVDPIVALQQGQQGILERLDELAPPAPVDPLAVELGLVAPPQPLPGQPVDPAQQQPPAAGQPQQPGAPQQPGISTPPGLQVDVNDPQQLAQLQAVEGFIEARAKTVAESMLNEKFTPFMQQQERTRKQGEAQQVVAQNPRLQDPAWRDKVFSQARQWAREVTGSEQAAGEPGWIEMTHLAMQGLELSAAAAPGGAQPGVQPGGGEVPIEGGGGAQPQAAQTDSQKIAQEIVAAKPGGGLNSFWNG